MNCLEFKNLALSTPDSEETDFVIHGQECPDCRNYLSELRQMDSELSSALNVSVPRDLIARLQLNTELDSKTSSPAKWRSYSIAASVVVAIFAGSIMFLGQRNLEQRIGDDYVSLLSGVVEHMNEQPVTPVWQSARANKTVDTLLTSYDTPVRFKEMQNLQFGRICPMGQYRGLHASLETSEGQITFAFIKGEPLGDILDSAYEGYITRVKPIKGGNLIIISRSQRSLESADRQLEQSLYWDI